MIRSDLVDRIATTPIYGLLGVEVVEAYDGAAAIVLHCDDRHVNVDGVVHGGIIGLAVDTAMGFAIRSRLGPGWVNRTLTLSIEWFAPATASDTLRIDARVDQSVGRYCWATAQVIAQPGRRVARAGCLCAVREAAHPGAGQSG
jgi:uncharacterized protein (TIGR00369 family)